MIKNIPQIRSLSIWLILSSLTVGCSSGLPKGTTQSFKTRITDSGLKHFELRLRNNRPQRLVEVENPYSRNPRPRRSTIPQTEREGERLVARLEATLAEIMEQNDYCREGYWILKADPFDRSPYIRGECHDLATPEDRSRYPDTLLTW